MRLFKSKTPVVAKPAAVTTSAGKVASATQDEVQLMPSNKSFDLK
jgi:hypothetical protein